MRSRLIPANNKLDSFDKLMCDTDFAEYKLKEFADTIKEQYDYIRIDGMPNIPARSTLLNSSLEGMDDLFDFKTKEEANY